MKKQLFIALALTAAAAGISNSVMAADACTGTAGNGATVAGNTDGTTFVRVSFAAKCSANVLSQYTDQQTTFAVAAGSTKGKNTFIGNTAGGAIKPDTGNQCAASGCDSGKVGSALTTAEGMASSS